MRDYRHSVRLAPDRCRGCVNCIKRCPTEAIRIRGGKAQITESRCIDCGECIRRCPNHAKTAVSDDLEALAGYAYNVALPAPALYAQFPASVSVPAILAGLQQIGFDDVGEVAEAAEIVTAASRDYLKHKKGGGPVLSSACPAVVRLIQVRFPELITHLMPISAPVDIAAYIAQKRAIVRTGLPADRIGIWFITPCPAKVTAVSEPSGMPTANISGAIGISKIYGKLLKNLPNAEAISHRQIAGAAGAGWTLAGGEVRALGEVRSLAVDGIHSVSEMLEQVALGKLDDIDYIECLACAGGCIGGPLTVENRFVAADTMKQRLQALREIGNFPEVSSGKVKKLLAMGDATRRIIEPLPALRLDEDIYRAMQKVEQIEQTLQELPGLDCGSCGSPNCKALAEDIVQGTACITDCVFKLRARLHDLAKEVVDLAEKQPPPMDRPDGDNQNEK